MLEAPPDDALGNRSPAWQRSSWCGSSGCVEVATLENGVAVRDSKQEDGPVLRYDLAEWAAFVAGVKGGEFDTPLARRS